MSVADARPTWRSMSTCRPTLPLLTVSTHHCTSTRALGNYSTSDNIQIISQITSLLGINHLTDTGNYSATCPRRIIMKLVYWPLIVGCYILYSKEGTGRSRSQPRRLLAVPNVTASRQRPLYQSPYCCIIVRCSAVLMPIKVLIHPDQFVFKARL